MSIAATLQKRLSRNHIAYDVLPHPPAEASVSTAQACRVPPDRLAKGVVVGAADRYVLRGAAGVAPGQLGRAQGGTRRELRLGSENEIEQLFEDCAPGAIPPIGECYGLDAVVEPRICDQPAVYFKGVDHATLVHVRQTQFAALTGSPSTRASPLAGELEGARERAWARASESGSVRRTGYPAFMRAPGPALV
jgi:Ala-tRNA(Pro) deacylase